MSIVATLFPAWDEGYREFAIALGGMPDADLWKRADPRLLSVGELAGHVAFWEAVRASGQGNQPDTEKIVIKSPLVDTAFYYYTKRVGEPFSVEIGTEELIGEVARIHEETKAAVGQKALDDPYPGWGTWGNAIQYQVFHVAYHTGQVYSVRHLMGHETEDN